MGLFRPVIGLLYLYELTMSLPVVWIMLYFWMKIKRAVTSTVTHFSC